MIRDAGLAGLLEPGFASGADGGTAAFVLVVRGDVADAGVQANAIVLVADRSRVRRRSAGSRMSSSSGHSSLDVAEEALHRRLVGRHAGAAEVRAIEHRAMNSRVEPEVISGAVVRHRQQDGPGLVVGVDGSKGRVGGASSRA